MTKHEIPELSAEYLAVLTRDIRDKNKDRYLEPHVIYVLRKAEKVTLPQLRYYWGVVLEDIADQTGYWPDEIHDFNKKNFGLKTSYYIGDEAHELIKGLSKMNKKQGIDFITRTIEHWTSKGVTIREPVHLSDAEMMDLIATEIHDD